MEIAGVAANDQFGDDAKQVVPDLLGVSPELSAT